MPTLQTIGIGAGIATFVIGITIYLWKLFNRIASVEKKTERYDKFFDAYEQTMMNEVAKKRVKGK